jgi:hypothetical protein
MTEMTPEVAAILRAPFPASQVGKLPRVTCGACSKDKFQKHCDKHQRSKCRVCDNFITSAHMHLDYVGHAGVTDRFLQADPGWTWEPVAFDQAGLPALDAHGGLWIRLTVAGVTRLGYGDAQGKQGPDAVKEAIGDALRNGGMRFGVGLDLWSKTPMDDHTEAPPIGTGQAAQPPAQRRNTTTPAGQPPQSAQQEAHLVAKAKLRKACDDSGWDMHKVADLFAGQHQAELGETTNAELIDTFTQSLFAMPDEDLKAKAAA